MSLATQQHPGEARQALFYLWEAGPPWTRVHKEVSNQVKARDLLRQYRAGERDFTLLSLRQAILSGVDLYGANLSGTDLSEADLSDGNLMGARLRRADLSRARLCGTNLRGADLGMADLKQADLSGADLSFANLEQTNATSEQLAQAKTLEGAILPDGTTHARTS